MDFKIVDRINHYFKASKTKYNTLIERLSKQRHYDQQIEIKHFFNDNPSGLLVLTMHVRNWINNNAWEKEADHNFKEGLEIRYLNYLTQVLGKQQILIMAFTDAIKLYSTNWDRVMWLFEGLFEGRELTHREFLIAAQVYYIHVFELVDSYAEKIQTNYKSNFKEILNYHRNASVQENSIHLDIPKPNISPRVEMYYYGDHQLKAMYKLLIDHNFISSDTVYTSFKHVMLQKNLEESDFVLWTDFGDNKQSNKITLIIFASAVVKGDTRKQNLFIKNFFNTYTQNNISIIFPGALNKSREALNKKTSKSPRERLLLEIIDSIE